MFIAGLVKMLPAPKSVTHAESDRCYDQLIHSLFRPPESGGKSGKLIALSSPAPGVGVSFVANQIGASLAQYDDKKILIVDAARLRSMSKAELEKWTRLQVSLKAGLTFLKSDHEKNAEAGSKAQKKMSRWQSSRACRRECLQILQMHFDYILIDCPSLKTSSEVILLSDLVDGIVMVVAAEKSRRDEILRSQKMIEMAEGKILGLVLNQRKYHIPGWLYRRI